jgi:hypothetical protein
MTHHDDETNSITLNVNVIAKVLGILGAVYIIAQVVILMPYRMTQAEKSIVSLQNIAAQNKGNIDTILTKLIYIEATSKENNEMLKQHMLKP